MALVKGFLQYKLPTEIPKYKYFVGVIVGLLMAFFLYALQYMTREMIRVSSSSEDDIWMLSDAEVSFYNLIFAFIALILGQSFCFEYLFNRPKQNFKARTGRWQNIINDQRILSWYFLTWFSKMGTMYGLLFCTAGLGDFYIMSFYPNFNYMFILIVIVLFLQSWNGLLLVFKRRAFKYMLFSAGIISGLSFGLSKVEIVDYKAVNEMVINNRLDVQYNLRIPNSKVYFDKNRRFRNLPSISLVTAKDNSKNLPLLFLDHEKVGKEKFLFEMINLKRMQSSAIQDLMPAFLRIDKDVPMSFVHEIKRELDYSDVQRLNYLVIPADAIYPDRYYERSNRKVLPLNNVDYFTPEYEEYVEKANAIPNKIDILISKQGYSMNGVNIPKNEMVLVIRSQILQNLDYGIFLNFTEDVNFETYFVVVSKIYEVVYSFRDEEAQDIFSMDYKSLEENQYERTDEMRETKRNIAAKYPLRFFEVWKGSRIQLPEKSRPEYARPKRY